MLTSDADTIPTYIKIRAALVKKYGDPSTSVVRYSDPYTKDDNDDLQLRAIKEEKLKIYSVWPENTEKNSGLMVSIGNKLTVEVTYETPKWAQRVAKDEQKETGLL